MFEPFHSPIALSATLPAMRGALGPDGDNLHGDSRCITVKADLGKHWHRLLAELPAVGCGLVMSANQAATLTSRRAYPKLDFNRTKAANAEAGLWVNGDELGEAYALSVEGESSLFLSAKFTNRSGDIVHGFSVTAESNAQEFYKWVGRNRTRNAGVRHQDRPKGASREPESDPQDAPQRNMLTVTRECARRRLPVRATVFNAGIHQRVAFTPHLLQPVDEWWFASDENALLGFSSERFTAVRVNPELGSEFSAAPVLTAEIGDQIPALRLELGDPTRSLEWNAIVHGILRTGGISDGLRY